MFSRPKIGWACLSDPDQGVTEWDTFTCAHCQYVTQVKAYAKPEDMGGLCKVCMGLICSKCVGKGCDPFEKKLERMEAKYHTLRSYGLI